MSLSEQMKHRDREMVPRFLVRAMFTLMVLSVSLVVFAQLTDRPHVGVLQEAPVVASREVTLVAHGLGSYDVMEDGLRLAGTDDVRGGFYGVIGRIIDRRRAVMGADPAAPITVVRRENGNVAILDPATELSIELIGYGADNVAAFARLLD
ncbi:MAG: photosystem II complex assembly protein [Rhodobacteraceae bacterium HLUCCA08]|nr:MAG: photosystem II complex assembly protein [Rhodobacteraceae bacterium HLUCCA08]